MTKMYAIVDSLIDARNATFKGLESNIDGFIHLFDKTDISASVLLYQLGMNNTYCLLEIDSSGITGKIVPLDWGDGPIDNQFEVNQEIIDAKFVVLVGQFNSFTGEKIV